MLGGVGRSSNSSDRLLHEPFFYEVFRRENEKVIYESPKVVIYLFHRVFSAWLPCFPGVTVRPLSALAAALPSASPRNVFGRSPCIERNPIPPPPRRNAAASGASKSRCESVGRGQIECLEQNLGWTAQTPAF